MLEAVLLELLHLSVRSPETLASPDHVIIYTLIYLLTKQARMNGVLDTKRKSKSCIAFVLGSHVCVSQC